MPSYRTRFTEAISPSEISSVLTLASHRAGHMIARFEHLGSLELMQGAAYKAHITKRTGRR